MSKPVPKRPLTDDERAAIKAIQHVGMPAGCWDKRFRRDVLDVALETGKIGEKSVAQLWRLFIRYRRQIAPEVKAKLLPMAEKLSAPDFRKQQAAAREQARIDKMIRDQGVEVFFPSSWMPSDCAISLKKWCQTWRLLGKFETGLDCFTAIAVPK